jgi:hypothetical protein
VRLAELAEALVTAEKNALVLDTCILLDVIRSPFRDTMYVVEFAVRMDAEIQNGTLPFSLVLPSLLRREWTDNVATVREELLKTLERHLIQSRLFEQLHHLLYKSLLSIPDVTTYAFTETLEQVCNRIIAPTEAIEQQDQYLVRAMQRVHDKRAPAQAGKESSKDCQIFEEVLGLGRELRGVGFARKIVFASSNTKEYGVTGNPFPGIKADLDTIGAEFASSLNYAYHVASS